MRDRRMDDGRSADVAVTGGVEDVVMGNEGMGRVRTSSGATAKVHYEGSGDAATLCGRGADHVEATTAEATCANCVKAWAKLAAAEVTPCDYCPAGVATHSMRATDGRVRHLCDSVMCRELADDDGAVEYGVLHDPALESWGAVPETSGDAARVTAPVTSSGHAVACDVCGIMPHDVECTAIESPLLTVADVVVFRPHAEVVAQLSAVTRRWERRRKPSKRSRSW